MKDYNLARSAMKEFIFFARAYLWLIFALPLALSAQDDRTYPNYVVIGAFAYHKNAVRFTGDANHQRFPARFEMNPNRNLYYVYVLTTDDREYAIAEAVKLRAETKYFDTWVYSGALGNLVLSDRPDQDFNPLTGQRIESVTAGENTESQDQSSVTTLSKNDNLERMADRRMDSTSPLQEDGAGGEPVRGQATGKKETIDTDRHNPSSVSDRKSDGGAITPRRRNSDPNTANVSNDPGTADTRNAQTATTDGERADDRNGISVVARAGSSSDSDRGTTTDMTDDDVPGKDETAVQGPPPKRASEEPLETADVVGKNFYFHLFRADNGHRVEGEVDAIDFERSRKMATYSANKPVTVRMPSGELKQVSFLCQVFGYRKQQREFDPNDPANDIYLDDQGNIVVPFELVRLQKGDIAIMYNVFFFKDAAVMRPESRYEVNNLLALLNENPSYNIKIHGHTNGNASGKIIRMDKPGNFYSLAGTKQGFGSARKLSGERAEVIRNFLISSGISPDRMEIKAWGGKKPIHDKHSVRANENVRVEIEILSD